MRSTILRAGLAFDAALAKDVNTLIETKIARASRVTPDTLNARGVARHLVDGVARLFKPFL